MRKSTRIIASLPLGMILFISALNYKFGTPTAPLIQKDYDSMVKFSAFEDATIHCGMQNKVELCALAAEKYHKELKIMVLIGNSQLHTINEYQQDDQTVAFFLHEKLRRKGVFLITVSYPNINLKEIVNLIGKLEERLEVNKYIISATFDDTRNSEIRPELKQLSGPLSENGDDNEPNLIVALENKILKLFEKYVPNWHRREALRVNIISKLHELRNAAFNITPSSKRKKLTPQYNENMEALTKILARSKIKPINAALIIAPIRSDFPQPYIQGEYDAFKKDIRKLAVNSGSQFFDMGDSVPNKFWGMRADDKGLLIPDFMHFKSNAHLWFSGVIDNALFQDEF